MEEIDIRPITLEDTDNIVRWRNSVSVRRNLFSQEKISMESHFQYFHDFILTGRCVQFIIELNIDKEKKDIGTAFIKNIDKKNRNGEFGIFLSDEVCGKGYSRMAIEKIIEYSFQTLNLHRLYLYCFSNNKRAIIAFEKAGFILEGIQKEAYYKDGEFLDIVDMAIINT